MKHLIIDFIPLNSVDKLLFAKLDKESHVLWLYMSVLVYPDIFKLQIYFPQHARMVLPRHHGATALSRARGGMTKGGRGLCGKLECSRLLTVTVHEITLTEYVGLVSNLIQQSQTNSAINTCYKVILTGYNVFGSAIEMDYEVLLKQWLKEGKVWEVWFDQTARFL